MPSRDGGRQSQIRSYITRGLQIPVNTITQASLISALAAPSVTNPREPNFHLFHCSIIHIEYALVGTCFHTHNAICTHTFPTSIFSEEDGIPCSSAYVLCLIHVV